MVVSEICVGTILWVARWVVERSTTEEEPVSVPESLSQYMSAMGRKGGQIGGKRRLVTMTPAQRKKAAQKAAQARWGKPK